MEFKKGIDWYVIYLPKTHNDTITTESGMELFVDPEWRPQDHRILKAELVSIPKKEKVLKVGDIVHFHPNVVNNQMFNIGNGYYIIRYTEDRAMIFAKENPNEGFVPVFDYLFVKQEEEQKINVAGLDLGGVRRTKGEVAFLSDKAKEDLNLSVGDEIAYRKFREFTIEVDGVDYVRLRSKDVNFVYA